MKTKKLTKKLTLNKTTVSNLTMKDLDHVRGGGSRPGPCPSVDYRTCWC